MEAQKVKIELHRAFQHPLFFDQQSIWINEFTSFKDSLEIPFYHDLMYTSHGYHFEKLPWESTRTSVPILFDKWFELKAILIKHFQERDTESATAPMLTGLALLLDALHWGNGQPVTNLKEWETILKLFKNMPINIEERLHYIFRKPNHYHSFIQLDQLFNEYQKKFQINQIKNNKPV